MNAQETKTIIDASTTDHRDGDGEHRSDPAVCHEQVASSHDDLGAATARRSSIDDDRRRTKASVHKLGSVALVATVSMIAAALLSATQMDAPRAARVAAASGPDSPNQLSRTDHEMIRRGLVRGEGPLYFEYSFPQSGEYCHSEEFDPCHQDSLIDDEWMKSVPEPCAKEYEEAGFYTSNKGVKIEENDFVKNALLHLEMYNEGSDAKNCAGYYFMKIRACVPNGSSCFPNGQLEIRQDTYYNLEAQDLGLLGSYNGLGERITWTHPISRPYIPDPSIYHRGPFYPDSEYQFHPFAEDFQEYNQWRFVEAPGSSESSPLYYLINRWTGQYMGSGTKEHNGNTYDQVGRSKLYEANAITVSIHPVCDREGTVQISATNLGEFKHGMTENLFFTAKNPEPEFTEHVGGGCYWQTNHPPCPEGQEFIRWDNNGCFITFYRRVCKEYHAKPEYKNKRPLQFYIKEVTKQIEPFHSAETNARPVPINIESEKDTSQIALESIAPKYAFERSQEAIKWVYDNVRWQPIGKALPPANLRFRGAAKAVVFAQRLNGSLGKSTKALSSVSRLLKFASLGGPHFAIASAFMTAAIDFWAAEANEKRFQAIEDRLKEIIRYVDERIKEATEIIGIEDVLSSYKRSCQETYINYNKELDDSRTNAFMDLDFSRTYNEQRGEAKTWIDQLANMKRDFQNVLLPTAFISIEFHEIADVYMDAYPTIVATYITIVEEIVSLKAVLDTANDNSCEQHVNIEFGLTNDKLVEMKEQLEVFETAVTDYRWNETKGLPFIEQRKEVYFPDCHRGPCPLPISRPIKYTFHNVTESDRLLLKVPEHQEALYDRVLQLRREEVSWTFANFGKYNLDVLYQAINNAKSSIVSTCEELENNSIYATEFVEFGKIEHFSLAFTEDRETCSDRQA